MPFTTSGQETEQVLCLQPQSPPSLIIFNFVPGTTKLQGTCK